MSENRGLPIHFLIITALEEEFIAVESHFLNSEKLESDDLPSIYFSEMNRGALGNITIAYTSLYGMGNPRSAALTGAIISKVNPAVVVMFGLAGGNKLNNIGIGDVLVADDIVYYEPTKELKDGFEDRKKNIAIDSSLLFRLRGYLHRLALPYRVFIGAIAVGEKVIKSIEKIEELNSRIPNLVGVEMESYGVGLAASLSPRDVSFMVIRGVCDLADDKKDDKYRNLALSNAMDFLKGFLIQYKLPELDGHSKPKFIAIKHTSMNRRPAIDPNNLGIENSDFYEIKIDQTKFFEDIDIPDVLGALQYQKEKQKEINDFMEGQETVKFGYFGLAHIPLMFHLGFAIQRVEFDLFASGRQTGEWIALSEQPNFPKFHVDDIPQELASELQGIAVKINVTFPVHDVQVIPSINKDIQIYSMGLADPKPDIVLSSIQVNTYAKSFYDFVVEISQKFSQIKKLHVFYSGPPALAFKFGQQISTTMFPEVIVYNFSRHASPPYSWAININTGEVLDFKPKEQ